MDATHSAAYILGASKLFHLGNNQILVGVETLKQSETPSNLLRGAGNWYVHGGDNGYSHWNQIIGAGVGYGTDLQSIWGRIAKVKSNFSFSFQFQKISRDPITYFYKWIDYCWNISPMWKRNKMIFSSSMTYIQSKNSLIMERNRIPNFCLRVVLNYQFLN
jgi:hypothetical protein